MKVIFRNTPLLSCSALFVTGAGLASVAAPAYAQVASAALAGTVADPSGAPIAGAAVSALNTGTGVSQSTTSGSDGTYTFSTLQPGIYRVTVTETGFAKSVQEGVQLTIGQAATLKTPLSVGSAEQTVSVSANAELINQTTAEISQLINEKSVRELPLNGRDPSSLVLQAPGIVNVLNASGNLQSSNSFPTESGAAANGGRQGSTYYLLDGVPNMDYYLLLAAPFPNADATQEFRVITNNFDARYGFAPGAVVSIQTRSGSNNFHGGAFEFLRNSVLNAGNYFSHQVDSLKRNQFGGFLGGPIQKDKLFFFGNYQQTQATTTPQTNTTFTPTAAMLAGDFSAVPATLKAPFATVNGRPNQIDPALLNPAAVALASLVPLGQVAATGQVSYIGTPQRYSYKEATGRLDYDINASQRLTVRSFIYRYDQPEEVMPGNALANTVGETGRLYNELVSHTWTINANSVNTISAAWLQNDYFSAAHVAGPSGQPVCLSQFIQISDPAGLCYMEGGVNISNGYQEPYTSPNRENRRTWSLNDDYSRVLGRHTLTFGGNFLHQYALEVSAYPQNADVNFTGQYTGFGLADFLLGYAQSVRQGAGETQDPHGIQLGLYAQDQWRWRPNFTLTAGVRWEPNLPPSVTNGRGAYFIPGAQSTRYPNAPTGLVFPGDHGLDNKLMPSDYAQVAPRVGIAWQPASLPDTAIRAAFGIFFAPLEYSLYNHTADVSPFSPLYYFAGTSSAYIPFSNPYSFPGAGTGGVNPFPPFASSSVVPAASSTFPADLSVLSVFAPDFKLGTTQSWNVSIEQQATRYMAAHLAYVGSESYHLVFPLDLNPGFYNTDATLSGNRLLFPAFSSVYENDSAGTSRYNSLQASLELRPFHGLQAQSSFTWARTEDVFTGNSIAFDLNIPDPFDLRHNFGKSDLNIPLISVTNFLYTSPALRGINPVLRQALGNWEISGLYTLQSGTPFSISGGDGNNNSAAQQDGDRADFAPGGQSVAAGVHQGSKQQWLTHYFDPTRFVVNAPGTFGNTPRNIYQGPGVNTADLGLIKNWEYRERWRLQFRWEMFNALNHANFANPNSDPSSGNFGQITSIGPVAPRVQQAALKLTF